MKTVMQGSGFPCPDREDDDDDDERDGGGDCLDFFFFLAHVISLQLSSVIVYVYIYDQ